MRVAKTWEKRGVARLLEAQPLHITEQGQVKRLGDGDAMKAAMRQALDQGGDVLRQLSRTELPGRCAPGKN